MPSDGAVGRGRDDLPAEMKSRVVAFPRGAILEAPESRTRSALRVVRPMDPSDANPGGAAPIPGRITGGVFYPEIETRSVLWEEPGGVGWFPRLHDTWTFVVAQPAGFFAALPQQGKWSRAFGFAVLAIAVGQVCALVMGRAVLAPVVQGLDGVLPADRVADLRGLLVGAVLAQVLLLPLNVVAAVSKMIARALSYALAAWVVGASVPVDRMLRIESYAHATDWMYLGILAVCLPVSAFWTPTGGALVGWGSLVFLLLLLPPLYYLLIVFLGLRFLAGLTTGKALFAVFFPFLLIVFAVGGVLFEWLLVEVALHLLLPGP